MVIDDPMMGDSDKLFLSESPRSAPWGLTLIGPYLLEQHICNAPLT